MHHKPDVKPTCTKLSGEKLCDTSKENILVSIPKAGSIKENKLD